MASAPRKSDKTTIVEEIVLAICREIFLGEFEPGERLPSFRTLAKKYDTTLPTTQRVISRMEELGIIDVRHGSGATVLDPWQYAHPSAVPYWLEALRDRPAEARDALDGFLELRRTLAVSLLVKSRERTKDPEFERVHEAVEHFAELSEGEDLAQMLEADTDVVRALMSLKPNIAMATVFNVFEDLLRRTPSIQRAMYRDPEENVLAYRAIVSLLESEESDAMVADTIESAMADFDRGTLDHFEAALRDDVHR